MTINDLLQKKLTWMLSIRLTCENYIFIYKVAAEPIHQEWGLSGREA